MGRRKKKALRPAAGVFDNKLQAGPGEHPEQQDDAARQFTDATLVKIDKILELLLAGGSSLYDACKAVGLGLSTFYAWKDAADDNKARYLQAMAGTVQSLVSASIRSAMGYDIEETAITRNVTGIEKNKDGSERPVLGPGSKITRTKRHYPPNSHMLQFLLNNMSEEFKNKITIDGTVKTSYAIDYSKFTTQELRQLLGLIEKGRIVSAPDRTKN